ncbi:MAG: TrkA C-terminal domain-containing protein [Haloarculaceae archaeon]
MDYRIDEIDKRILYHLAADARNVSAPTIAEEMDVTPGTIRNRIRQLEENGFITGYHAQIEYERVEGRVVNLFICTAPVADRERLATRTLDVSGVVNVRELMAGKRNLHVVGVGTDTNDITRIARDLSDLGVEIEEEDILQHEMNHPYDPFGPENGATRPSLTDFVSLTGGAEVMEISVAESAPVAGLSLSEADTAGILQDTVLVVGIERDDEALTPKGDTRIQAGDIVTLFSRENATKEAIEPFSGSAESTN